ncbi:MAG: dihydroorotate dehydrogenase electron transfer subunit [Armatimonadetes bacterium]|nr:dihydroorotate dehydrogenase electron transfer subunit [Armatimonadota bacterium]
MPNTPCGMKSIYDCKLIEQHEVSPGVWLSKLTGPEIARGAVAGQFVNVQVAKTTDPLLRRPFSLHAVDREKGTFSLLYVLVGRGTALLHRYVSGDIISVVGPLGNGFDLGDSPDAEHIVVAGGCGAAPLHFLCDSLCEKWGCEKVTVLVGGKSKDALLCEDEFREHGVLTEAATDDASYGYGGFVTQLLQAHLDKRSDASNLRIYSCGPHGMMREVARICSEHEVQSCQVSLENKMACGIGVCTGCIQKIKKQSQGCDPAWEYKRVCADGPVFEAENIIWE